MVWYSILPAELVYFESWIVRCFLFLGVVTLLPWATLLILDMCLYIWRLVTYYIPAVGGRARGRQRPRAPSLNELPERFGLSATAEVDERSRKQETGPGEAKRRAGRAGRSGP